MKNFELKFPKSLIKQDPYTFNSFNDDIRDFDVYIDYLNKNFKKLDFTKVDKFYDYICSVINEMDYLFVEELENTKELDLYLNNLNYVYYDEIKIKNRDWRIFNTHYLFDIKDGKSKQFVKDNIKFNLSDECLESFIIETDRKYILNVDGSRNGYFEENGKTIFRMVDYFYNYGFVKDDFLQLLLFQQDGYIEDYRDIDELTFLKRKNLKIENKNYDTYDYKMFSNDISDNKYIDYIYHIIDESDYIFIEYLSYEKLKVLKEFLKRTYYDLILLEDKSKNFNADYIFDIRDKKSKEVIKNNIIFNLSDNDRNPIIEDTDKKYILNEIGKEEYEYIDYGFIKDDTLLAVLHQKDGFIDDYRSINVRKKELEKNIKS